MSKNNLDVERRHRQALQRLGTDNPICVGCGENNPHCLELHHVAGQHFDTDLAIVCRNCHRKLSDVQRGHPKPTDDDPGTFERIGHYLLGLADLLKMIAEKLGQFGSYLVDFAKTSTAMAQGQVS